MAFINHARVWEIGTVTGTGTINLPGTAQTGYRTFASSYATGDTCTYEVHDQTTNAWEVGVGTLTSGSPWTLARTLVLESSNANALVSFAGNTCDITVIYPSTTFNLASKFLPGLLGPLRIVTGNFYTPQGPAAAGLIVGTPATYMPFYVPNQATLTSLSVVTSAANTGITAYVGLYADDGTGKPGTLLASPAGLALSASGTYTATVNVPLMPGLYWARVVASANWNTYQYGSIASNDTYGFAPAHYLFGATSASGAVTLSTSTFLQWTDTSGAVVAPASPTGLAYGDTGYPGAIVVFGF